MARRFHPGNNFGFDTSEMMKMINTAKEGLQDQLRKNDALRENNVSKQQNMIFQFHLITILIQNQAVHHLNQRHHFLKNPHYQLNTLMIMKKHP